LLVWTTTPWTLPANLAITAHPDFKYFKIADKKTGEKFYIHEKLLKNYYKDPAAYEVIKNLKGSELDGKKYKQLIPAFKDQLPSNAFRILVDTYVTDDTGTALFTPLRASEKTITVFVKK
jgi:isoleucyl-tRNA synthetase